MRRLEVSSGLLLTILLISCLLGAYALSKPAYLPEKYPSFAPGLLAVYGQKLVVHDPAKGSIAILDPETGGLRSFPAPKNVRDLEISGSWLALAPSGSLKLLIYDLETGESRELRLPGEVYALESADGLFWASIPDRGLIVGIDPASLRVVRRIEIAAAYGPESMSVHGQNLWIIGKDQKAVVRVDLESGEEKSAEVGGGAMAIKGFEGGAVVATARDEVLKLSKNLGVEERWELEKASSIDVRLYVLPDGRIIYVSPSRWVVGEIEGSEIREVKVGGRIAGSAISSDRVWFTESSTRKIGYVPLSRPPKIEDFKVERLGPDSFKVSAKATDPDGDLSRVLLFTFYKEIIGPEQNQSVEMEPSGDDLYTATITLKRQKAEIYAVALDEFNNTARSEKVQVEIQRIQTVSTTQTTTQAQGSSLDIYTVGSSLTLLIPILIALFYFKLKPKKRRKRRK
ncbi:MAG: hypothetical protein J7K49_06845 [Thaumarchaeota archaeon]|nr:hypothetical protein [Nitrososphaerota archaeon]